MDEVSFPVVVKLSTIYTAIQLYLLFFANQHAKETGEERANILYSCSLACLSLSLSLSLSYCNLRSGQIISFYDTHTTVTWSSYAR